MSTTKQLRALANSETGKTLSIPLTPKGSGSLVARRVSTGVRLYYQYKFAGKLTRIPFGSFDERGDAKGSADLSGYTLNGGLIRANKLAELAREHGDLAGHLKQRQFENAKAIQDATSTRELEALSAERYSLERLCIAYCDYLKANGKTSAATVRNALNRWVIDHHPALAATKAAEITTDDVMGILTAIVDAGHKTTVNRVRSYLRAAFAFGIGSATNPLLASKAKGFRLRSNPVAGTQPVAQFESTSDRVLTEAELTELLRAIQASDKPAANCAELSLRLGGQRISQLLETKPTDVDEKKGTLVLRDPKGRRNEPRIHLLPIDGISSELLAAIRQVHPRRKGAFGGLALSSVSKHVVALSRIQEGEPYTWRDVRRTVETMMAAMGISKDTRAQIQSHGISGVQAKHYDRYSYMPEKQAALKAWNKKLDELLSGVSQQSNVVSIGGEK